MTAAEVKSFDALVLGTGEQPTPPECPARNFQGLWSQVLQCFQDTRPSVGDAYRLKMLLVEHEKEQG